MTSPVYSSLLPMPLPVRPRRRQAVVVETPHVRLFGDEKTKVADRGVSSRNDPTSISKRAVDVAAVVQLEIDPVWDV